MKNVEKELKRYRKKFNKAISIFKFASIITNN